MVRVSSAALLLLFALGAAAQTPPPPAPEEKGLDSPGLVTKQIPNHNGGLVTYYSGNRLTDDQSQTAVNVLFDRDSGVIKRSGQQLYGTIAGCASQIRSGGYYLSPAGNAYMFEACGNHVYVSAGDGNFAVIGGTISSTANVYMKQGLGVMWIVDGVDTLWSTNGVTVSSYPAAPVAQYVGIFQGRVALGNVNGAVSEIYLSGYNNGGDYTLPAVIVDTSPAIFGLNGLNDGRTVTCVSDGYRDVLILWNRDEMYGLYGSGNSSFILRKLSEIGCDEQETVQEFDGKLRWLSQYGVYMYDGLNTQRISDPIKDQILNIIASEPGSLSLTQNSFADWSRGNLAASGPGATLSDTILLNSVVPGTSTFVDNTVASFANGTRVNVSTSGTGTLSLAVSTNVIADGNFQTGTNWSLLNTANYSGTSGSVSAANGSNLPTWCGTNPVLQCPSGRSPCAYLTFGGTGSAPWVNCQGYRQAPQIAFVDGATGNVLAQSMINVPAFTNPTQNIVTASAVATSTSMYVCLTENPIGASASINTNCLTATPGSGLSLPVLKYKVTLPVGFSATVQGLSYTDSNSIQNVVSFSSVTISSYTPTGTYTSPTFDTSFSTPVLSVATVGVSSTSVGTLTLQQETSPDNVSWGAPTTLTSGAGATGGQRYWRYLENFATSNGTTTATSTGLAPMSAGTTGYFITGCFPVAPIVSWGNLQSLNNAGNGSLTYYVSTGTTCDSVQQATATWTAQSINTTIGVSTAAYIGVRVLLGGITTFDPNNVPTLNSITVNWNSAAGRPRMATQVFDNRYWMAFTTSTVTVAYNNNVLVFDSMGHWSQFQGINASSLLTYKRILYAGSSLSDGKVITENTGNNDLGQPILFDFRTPDYELNAFNTVDLYDLNLEFNAVSSAYAPAMTVQYYADHNVTPYTLGSVALTVGTRGLIYSNARFGSSTALPAKVHTVSFEILDNTTTPITFYRSMIRYTPEDGP